jgi:hypothetical protein
MEEGATPKTAGFGATLEQPKNGLKPMNATEATQGRPFGVGFELCTMARCPALHRVVQLT